MPDNHANNWPDLLIGLYDNLTGRGAEITYEFDNMHIKIPSGTGASAEHAEWVLHGTMKIRTRDTGTSPNCFWPGDSRERLTVARSLSRQANSESF